MKPYTRLNYIVREQYINDRVLTDDEKLDIGVAVQENITPYEAHMNISGLQCGDIYWSIYDDYNEYSDIEVVREYINHYDCDTIEDYILDYDLLLPDRDDMIETLVSDIDEEDYINERYQDILDIIPDQFVYNLDDNEIVEIYRCFVNDSVWME